MPAPLTDVSFSGIRDYCIGYLPKSGQCLKFASLRKPSRRMPAGSTDGVKTKVEAYEHVV